ncbi:acetyl-CoA carboxylase biotin carboxyl carrier protein [Streptococcus moroccensis]|uniref:Biotin carboxyl carrier protein of acetyl-CoA carboxylase n=1 Tax=Streptococcus moroccensis TaxID=1451356 RepID=A0ABT9YU52_9STRE|nr:acetyl-CoA carboxylase biotin carboxyl carrier protein [Streptococcus moroccensis]MDQ0223117.1 acetyl-CoA carboxylase biotin carboxyl carrier protein [Streptococcus moroccensis]
MQLSDIKDLMAQFDQSSLKEFSYKNAEDELAFSKNENKGATIAPAVNTLPASPVVEATPVPTVHDAPEASAQPSMGSVAEGDLVESPLVGVVYLSPGPDKPAFVSVGDQVKKGQTLLIIEAMKVMNEIPAPQDGVITEILVSNEEVADFGKGLVRIK